MKDSKLILVTGPTGYIGGRLVPRLLEAGHRVRCFARDAKRLDGYPWRKQVEVIEGDALDPSSLAAAMKQVSVAYYLIHGKQGGRANAVHDLVMARNFSEAAQEAGIERIIYLGELVDPTTNLSQYLRSRHETGHLLRRGSVPVTEFRAGMIVGSGSALFEMIRYLAEREPVLICPAWFFSQAQPIAVRDVLAYLIAALGTPESVGRVIEIGGPTLLTYADMLLEYASERGFKRTLIRTPFYAPLLSAYWVHMVTPIHWRMVLPLIEGLHAKLIVRDQLARKLFPNIEPIDFHTALRLALARIQGNHVETSWSDALVTAVGDVKPYTFRVEEGMFIERRRNLIDIAPETVFRSYSGIGGERGWLYMDWAWAFRGWVDKVIGGVGIRRGRRHPDEIRAGESLDFWRVEAVEKDRLLLLRAEMKVPGKAWLEFRSELQEGRTLLTVTAYFAPRGLSGFLYWYAMWPFHAFLFNGLTRRLAARAHLLARSYG
ncbi:MAG: SDR family oxidoreductase [Chloroflexi bacterium]|nr:SDR family oxidoreductase [Chloroflexota bacterium]